MANLNSPWNITKYYEKVFRHIIWAVQACAV